MVPESNFGGFSGIVPEAFHVSPEDIFDEDPILSALSAKIVVALSVVLISYFVGHLSAWKNMSAFCIAYSWGFRKIYVCVPVKVAGQNQYL